MTRSSKRKQPKTPPKVQTKTEKVLSLLKRDGGVTLAEIGEATNWLPHSARAALTGFRKKGYTVGKAKCDGATRYSIIAEPQNRETAEPRVSVSTPGLA